MVRSLLAVILVSTGCGGVSDVSQRPVPPEKMVTLTSAKQAEDVTGMPTDQALPRKIIYEATVQLLTEDFTQLERQIQSLVQQHGGYLTDVVIDRTQGQPLVGHWTARLPVDRYSAFLSQVSQLGVASQFNQAAQDVTQEYVDLESRIRNQKHLESRIVELIRQSNSSIKEVIEIEKELARVRGDMEVMEGRMRYLANRTALTTVTIHGTEEKRYVPPQAPAFTKRVREAWFSSLESLRRLGEELAIAATATLPWLVMIALLVLPCVWVLRICCRSIAGRTRGVCGNG